MPDAAINLGTVFALVQLDTSKLAFGRAVIAGEFASIGAQLDRVSAQAEADGVRVAEASIGR
jgi:hypothetical protein